MPTLIIVESHIGYGAPHKHDTSAAHGEPLGEEEVRLAKRSYGWPEDAKFLVPDGVREHFHDGVGRRGQRLHEEWLARFESYRRSFPDLADEIERMQRRELPANWDAKLPVFAADAKGLATRDSSGKVLNAIAAHYPWLIGGAADLSPSTKTRLMFEGAGDLEAETPGGRNMHFGIREHAMGAIVNGLALSKIRPFGAGFLIFSDYMKPPIRLGALMELPVIYVFTHDSIGVGQDGPTHQPVEQLVGTAQHSRPDHAPACRRQRSRRSLARRHRSQASAGVPGIDAASRCRRSTASASRRRPAWRAAPISSPTPMAASLRSS